MVAGGFNQNPQQAQAFFQGYQVGWKRFQETIVSDPRFMQELRVTDLSPLFNKQPESPSPLPVPVPPIPSPQPQMPIPAPPQAAMMTQGAGLGSPYGSPQFSYGSPPQVPTWPSVPAANPGLESVTQAPSPPKPSEPNIEELNQKRENEEKERVRNMTTPKESPMKIEEITAAASPVDVPNGPTVLGSVMGPGFVPRSQRETKSNDSGNNGADS